MAENSRKKRAFEAWKNGNNGDNDQQFDQSKTHFFHFVLLC